MMYVSMGIAMRLSFLISIITCGVMQSNAFTPLTTSGCGITKTCFYDPAGCNPTTNCAFYTAWKIDSNTAYLDVEIGAVVNGANDYIAIGFSDDQLMGADGVTACHYTSSGIGFWNGHTNDYRDSSNPRVVTLNPGANFINASSPDDGGSFTAGTNVFQCRFKRLLVPSDVQLKNLNTATYYVMFARGSYSSQPGYHGTNKAVSSQKYDVSTVTSGGSDTVRDLSQTFTPITSAECGISKSCYSANDGAFLSWKPVGSMIEIEMFGTIPTASGYISMGLSSDTVMENDAVLACFASASGTVKSTVAYNVANGKYNTFISNFPTDFFVTSAGDVLGGSYTASSSTITCRIRRKINPTTNVGELKNASSPFEYYIMMARGSAVSVSGLEKHPAGLAIVSSASVDLSSTNYVILGSQSYPLAKAHGSLMILAWLLCAPIAIMIAGNFKPWYPNKRLCGEKVWFQLHRAMALSCLFLTIIAFILIFVEAGGYTTESSLPYAAHPILGIIVTALCITNPIMAIFRPAPTAPRRPIFRWAHRIVGLSASILSIPTIFIGFKMRKIGNDLTSIDTPFWILIAGIIFEVLILISISIVDRKSSVSSESAVMEMRANGINSSEITMGVVDKKEKFYNIIMIIYVVGLLAFVVSLISLIAIY